MIEGWGELALALAACAALTLIAGRLAQRAICGRRAEDAGHACGTHCGCRGRLGRSPRWVREIGEGREP